MLKDCEMLKIKVYNTGFRGLLVGVVILGCLC